MKAIFRKTYIIFAILILLIISNYSNEVNAESNENGEDKLVYIIPVKNEVERGLEAFLNRSTSEAKEAGADHIIFEIDTPGGRVDAAGDIATLFQNLDIPSTSYVLNKALSAGSYIALNTDNIYMAKHATMGASGVINQDGTAADGKAESAWLAAMTEAAKSKGRDPLYAAAMADPEIDLPELNAGKGKYLTLGSESAVEVGYAEGIVKNRVGLLFQLDLSNARIVETEPSFAEEVARFLTNPVVIPILLSIASLGLILELYTPGFGVAGTMGLTALVLFFYGHIIAGLAGLEAIILLVLGIILIIVEFFIAGGIVGLLGVGAVLGSLFMAGYDLTHMSISVAIALVVALVAAVILYKAIGFERGIFKRIILRDSTTTELGYVSSVNREDLLGLEGITATQLRPAGIAVFNDERVDVVSEGSFIQQDQPIKVVKVEGVRVVVRVIETL